MGWVVADFLSVLGKKAAPPSSVQEGNLEVAEKLPARTMNLDLRRELWFLCKYRQLIWK